MKPRRVACLLLLSVSASACGFIFSHGPPDDHLRVDGFSCTESNAGPIIDILWLGLAGLTLATADRSEYDPARVIAVGGAVALASGSAAIVGFNKSKRCRAAKRQSADRQAQWRAPRGVVVSPSVDTLAVGERLQLTATAHGSDGVRIPTATFTWTSSNDAIASVTNAGLVAAHTIGAVVIAARTDSIVGTAHLIVVARN